MIAELRALKAAVKAAGVGAHIGQVPSDARLPYVSLSAPPYDSPETEPVGGRDADDLSAVVRVLLTHTTEHNVYVALSALRNTLTPGLEPTPLPVDGRHAVIEFVRSEFVQTDRDITYGNTNRHPGYGVDSYRITSQKVGT